MKLKSLLIILFTCFAYTSYGQETGENSIVEQIKTERDNQLKELNEKLKKMKKKSID